MTRAQGRDSNPGLRSLSQVEMEVGLQGLMLRGELDRRGVSAESDGETLRREGRKGGCSQRR